MACRAEPPPVAAAAVPPAMAGPAARCTTLREARRSERARPLGRERERDELLMPMSPVRIAAPGSRAHGQAADPDFFNASGGGFATPPRRAASRCANSTQPATSSSSKRPGSGLSRSSTPISAPSCDDRHDQLGARRGVAGDVAGKGVDVVDALRLEASPPPRRRRPCRTGCGCRRGGPGTARAPARRRHCGRSRPS